MSGSSPSPAAPSRQSASAIFKSGKRKTVSVKSVKTDSEDEGENDLVIRPSFPQRNISKKLLAFSLSKATPLLKPFKEKKEKKPAKPPKVKEDVRNKSLEIPEAGYHKALSKAEDIISKKELLRKPEEAHKIQSKEEVKEHGVDSKKTRQIREASSKETDEGSRERQRKEERRARSKSRERQERAINSIRAKSPVASPEEPQSEEVRSWQDIKTSGLDLQSLASNKLIAHRFKKSQADHGKLLTPIIDFNSADKSTTVTVKSVAGGVRNYPRLSLHFTTTTPSLIWSKNPKISDEFLLDRDYFTQNADKAQLEIFQAIADAKEISAAPVSAKGSHNWYPKTEFLSEVVQQDSEAPLLPPVSDKPRRGHCDSEERQDKPKEKAKEAETPKKDESKKETKGEVKTSKTSKKNQTDKRKSVDKSEISPKEKKSSKHDRKKGKRSSLKLKGHKSKKGDKRSKSRSHRKDDGSQVAGTKMEGKSKWDSDFKGSSDEIEEGQITGSGSGLDTPDITISPASIKLTKSPPATSAPIELASEYQEFIMMVGDTPNVKTEEKGKKRPPNTDWERESSGEEVIAKKRRRSIDDRLQALAIAEKKNKKTKKLKKPKKKKKKKKVATSSSSDSEVSSSSESEIETKKKRKKKMKRKVKKAKKKKDKKAKAAKPQTSDSSDSSSDHETFRKDKIRMMLSSEESTEKLIKDLQSKKAEIARKLSKLAVAVETPPKEKSSSGEEEIIVKHKVERLIVPKTGLSQEGGKKKPKEKTNSFSSESEDDAAKGVMHLLQEKERPSMERYTTAVKTKELKPMKVETVSHIPQIQPPVIEKQLKELETNSITPLKRIRAEEISPEVPTSKPRMESSSESESSSDEDSRSSSIEHPVPNSRPQVPPSNETVNVERAQALASLKAFAIEEAHEFNITGGPETKFSPKMEQLAEIYSPTATPSPIDEFEILPLQETKLEAPPVVDNTDIYDPLADEDSDDSIDDRNSVQSSQQSQLDQIPLPCAGSITSLSSLDDILLPGELMAVPPMPATPSPVPKPPKKAIIVSAVKGKRWDQPSPTPEPVSQPTVPTQSSLLVPPSVLVSTPTTPISTIGSTNVSAPSSPALTSDSDKRSSVLTMKTSQKLVQVASVFQEDSDDEVSAKKLTLPNTTIQKKKISRVRDSRTPDPKSSSRKTEDKTSDAAVSAKNPERPSEHSGPVPDDAKSRDSEDKPRQSVGNDAEGKKSGEEVKTPIKEKEGSAKPARGRDEKDGHDRRDDRRNERDREDSRERKRDNRDNRKSRLSPRRDRRSPDRRDRRDRRRSPEPRGRSRSPRWRRRSPSPSRRSPRRRSRSPRRRSPARRGSPIRKARSPSPRRRRRNDSPKRRRSRSISPRRERRRSRSPVREKSPVRPSLVEPVPLPPYTVLPPLHQPPPMMVHMAQPPLPAMPYQAPPMKAPQRLTLDQRIELELGVKLHDTPPEREQPTMPPQFYYPPTPHQPQPYPMQMPPGYPHQPHSAMHVGSMDMTGARPPPPLPQQQVVQVGNMLQVVPTRATAVVAPTPQSAEPAPKMPAVPPMAEVKQHPLIKAILEEREKRVKEREARHQEREARRRERKAKRDEKMMSVTEKLKRVERNEGLVLGQDMDEEELLLEAMEPPSPPSTLQVIMSNDAPAGKSILVTPSVNRKSHGEKSVMFSDGILPGVGSESDGERPSAKKAKPKKKRVKKKVKVRLVRQVEPEEDESDNDLPPPSPPTEDAPPVFYVTFPFGGPGQYPVTFPAPGNAVLPMSTTVP